MKAGKDIHGHWQELAIRRKLLRNRYQLDYSVRSEIDCFLANHPKLNEIYRWKERIYTFYRTNCFLSAVKAFNRLLEQTKASELPEIQKLRRTLKKWKNEILCYFENGYTNGFTEAMDNFGKLVQKRGYGFRSFANYRLRTLCARLFLNFAEVDPTKSLSRFDCPC